MKENRPKTIPLSQVLEEIYNEDPSAKSEIEAIAEEYNLLRRLREVRKKAKLSQSELAKRSGINQDKISRIERGEYNPTINTVQRIVSVMGKSIKIV